MSNNNDWAYKKASEIWDSKDCGILAFAQALREAYYGVAVVQKIHENTEQSEVGDKGFPQQHLPSKVCPMCNSYDEFYVEHEELLSGLNKFCEQVVDALSNKGLDNGRTLAHGKMLMELYKTGAVGSCRECKYTHYVDKLIVLNERQSEFRRRLTDYKVECLKKQNKTVTQ